MINDGIKIALCCPASLPATQFGGIVFLALDLARELSKMGNEISIYTTDLDFGNGPKKFNKKLPNNEMIDNFRIKRTHVWASINLFYINPKMYFQMLNDDMDIIHTIGIRSFQSFIAAMISKKRKIPLIVSDQGGLTTHPDLQEAGIIRRTLYKIQNPMIKFIVNQASKISVANEYEQNIFSTLGVKSKTVIIKNGINLDELDSKNIEFKKKYQIEKKFILFLGRFSKVKGIDVLLNSVNILKNKSNDLEFKTVIMGVDFGFEKEMLKIIEELGLNDDVLVIKKPLREEVIAAYKECEFLTLPSRWELSPLTPLEGFAFKKPVISTDIHGIPYTITNNENGILIPLEDKFALAEAIMEFMQDSYKREKYGNNGYELVKNTCNSKIMAKKTLELYQDVIKNSK